MADEEKVRSTTGLFWGRASGLSIYLRVGGLVFVIATIASMSFSQLGFWQIGNIGGFPVYLPLLLAPVIMGVIAFGPITGTLLGLFGGTLALIHATFLPLDFLESIHFGTPLNTIGLFTFTAFIAGILFELALRRNPQGGKRVARIIVISLVVSFVASAVSLVNMVLMIGGFDMFKLAEGFLGIGYVSSAAQALADFVLIAALCLAADAIIRAMEAYDGKRSLFSVFCNYLVLVSAVVFMCTSAAIFSSTTLQEQDAATVGIDDELEYLKKQLDLQPDIDAQLLIGDYDKESEGVVFTTDRQGIIQASNDTEKFKVGTSFLVSIGEGDYFGDAAATEALLEYYSSGREPVLAIPDTDDNLTLTTNLAYLGLREYTDGFIGLHRTSESVFADRFNTMVSSAILAFTLVAAIAVLASILMQRLVVRRVDETNLSLAMITAGNLDERVPEQSTNEFASLADGINTTVEALGDMIDEVARRNEQDLTTAKTIQESSLPTEFPAFPDIDTFDIYASMKTAKEVGGDFYDFFPIDDTTKIGFVMADVSGKGIPAALFMMAARSQLRNYMEAGLPVNEAVDAANHQLCIGNDAGMFVTCWVGEFDYETGEVAYVNGGHNPPMLLHDDTWSWLTEVSGMPLGLFDGIPYDLHTLQLASGDMIYTYTDGVTEAMSATDELFGEDRLEAVLNKSKELSPRSVGVAVRRALADYTHDAEQSDDITMLILKYGVPPETGAVMVLPADGSQLVHVRNFINAELSRRKAPKHVFYEVDVFAEKLFVSMCRHAYPEATPENPGEMRIRFEYQSNPPTLNVSLSDNGIPHNPLAEIETPKAAADGESTGGEQGVPEATQIVDEMSYTRANGTNTVSFSKRW